MTRIIHTSRAADERILRAISLRRAGHKWDDIAAHLGTGMGETVQVQCSRVRRADGAESGESIEGAYW